MSNTAASPSSIIPVVVTKDWNTASNASIDVATELETAYPGVFRFLAVVDLIITMLKVNANGVTDKGRLTISANTGAGTWTNAWVTVPSIGDTVYICDIY